MAEDQESLPIYHKADKGQVIKVAILAAAVGVLIPLLTEAISNWVIVPIFCQDPNNVSICTNGGMISYYISSVLITIASVALLVNIDVYRPLVVAFGALLALWGLKGFLTPLFSSSFTEYLVISVIMYVASYLLFFWFMRLRSFGLAIFFAALTVILVRWVLLV